MFLQEILREDVSLLLELAENDSLCDLILSSDLDDDIISQFLQTRQGFVKLEDMGWIINALKRWKDTSN
jgi:hypothetical protein